MKKFIISLLFIIVAFTCFFKNVKASFDSSLQLAIDESYTCIYVDDKNHSLIIGYNGKKSNIFSTDFDFKIYYYNGEENIDGKVSNELFSKRVNGSIPKENKCSLYLGFRDKNGKYYYTFNNDGISKNDLSLYTGKNVHDDAIDRAEDKIDDKGLSCVYSDKNGFNVAATNLKSSLGTINVYITQKHGNAVNEVIQVGKPDDMSECPSYFLYAYKNDDLGSFGGTGNNTLYSQFGNDFNKLCSLAKEKSEEFDVLTLNGINISEICTSDYENYPSYVEPEGDADKVLLPSDVKQFNICDQDGVKQVFHIAGYLIFVAKLVVPLLLIIMGTIDVFSAIKDPDEKGIKDQLGKLIKRIIAAVIIFFIPTIINFAFSLIDETTSYKNDFSACGSCLFTPFNGDCNYKRVGEE